MKRLVMAVVVTGIAAAAFAAWGLAAPAGSTTAKGPATADKTRLPALPAEVRQRKRWIVGVKCDAPPFGYINVQGKNAGFDVEIAKWFSRYAFGRDNRVTFECAPTPAREPLLTTGRVDLVISTFTLLDRPRHADRLLARVLQGERAAAREERRARPAAERHRRPPRRNNERLDLRPLGAALFHEHAAHRHRFLHERAARVQPRAGRTR